MRIDTNGQTIVLTPIEGEPTEPGRYLGMVDRVPENLNENNLMAMCQACHLAYDRDQHTATRAGRSGT